MSLTKAHKKPLMVIQKHFAFHPGPSHPSSQKGTSTSRWSKKELAGPGLPGSSARGKLSSFDCGYTRGVLLPDLVLMNLLGPGQSQIEATCKRQMVKEHNVFQGFWITNSPWQELLKGSFRKHPVVLTELSRRSPQSLVVDKNHLSNLVTIPEE